MSYDEGALLEPLAVAVHAVQRANVTKSSRCLIIGAGAVGLLCAAAAQAVGCEDITIADIALNRLEFAHDKGFATAICPVMARRGATIDDSLAIAKETAEEFKMAGSVRGQYAGGSFHTTFECSGVESCVQAAIYVSTRSTVSQGLPRQISYADDQIPGHSRGGQSLAGGNGHTHPDTAHCSCFPPRG